MVGTYDVVSGLLQNVQEKGALQDCHLILLRQGQSHHTTSNALGPSQRIDDLSVI